MGLVSKVSNVVWNTSNKAYYESKGYAYTKIGDCFKVKTIDLTNGTNTKVLIKCDGCEKVYEVLYSNFKKCEKEGGKYYCNSCARNNYHKYYSFYDWCYTNKRNDILELWDYELNKCNPKEISYRSNKKVYFKCPTKKHKSELKNIKSITKSNSYHLKCKRCNCVFETRPDLLVYLSDINDAYKYSSGSSKKVKVKCPICGIEKNMSLNNLSNNGLSCQKCSDGFSYPEKFVFNILDQLHIDFVTQLSKTTFKWCAKYRYDFYFKYNNEHYIIETHGEQHYKNSFATINGAKTLKEEQENDRKKQELALNNEINHYIIVDCRKSELKWIKDNILKSELPKLINFKEEDINWVECSINANSSRVYDVLKIWNQGIKNIYRISNITKLDRKTVKKYLTNSGIVLNEIKNKIKNNIQQNQNNNIDNEREL